MPKESAVRASHARHISRGPTFFCFVQQPKPPRTQCLARTTKETHTLKKFPITDNNLLAILLSDEKVIACANDLLGYYDYHTTKQVATLPAALFVALNSSGETLYDHLVKTIKSLSMPQQIRWKKALYPLLLRAISQMNSDNFHDPYLQLYHEKTPTLEDIRHLIGIPCLSDQQLQKSVGAAYQGVFREHIKEGRMNFLELVGALTDNRFSFDGIQQSDMENIFGKLGQAFRKCFLADAVTAQYEYQVIGGTSNFACLSRA